MTNNFLLIMSLSGSVIFILYLLIFPIAKRYVSYDNTVRNYCE